MGRRRARLPSPATGGGSRWSRWGVLGLAGLLPLVDLGVVALVEPPGGLAAAAALVLLVLPLHLWIVSHALHDVRAPGAGWCVAALLGLTVLAMVLVGTTWSFLFSSLLVSVLAGLRARWALPGLAAVLALAWTEGASRYASDASAGVVLYILLVVLVRAVCLFVIVRLVAQLARLDAARAAVAVSAVEHERARTALELTTSLGPDLDRIGARAAALRPPQDGDDLSVAVGRVAEDARHALAQVRRIVARTRDHASLRALVAVGSMLRGTADRGAARAAAPASRRLGPSTHRALVLLVLVRLVLLGMLLFFVSGIGVDVRLPAWCAGAAVVVAALELPLALRTALGGPSARAGAAGVLVACAVAVTSLGSVVVLRDPSPFLFSLAFVSSAAVMVLPPRGRPVAAVATLLVLGWAGHAGLSLAGPPVAQELWYLLGYLPAVHLLAVGSLVASAHLVRALVATGATRTEAVQEAVDAESRRFARDLHDTLVQRLSAIALTADLVQRLLVRDPGAAAAELPGLVRLTDGLAEEALRAGQDRRAVSLADEARSAVQLLRAAGVRTDLRLPEARHEPEVDTLLGWAVREAVTNVVRHSAATRCSIVVSADRGATALVITNDGAGAVPPVPVTGHGLAGLGERVRVVSGSVSADLAGPGEFRLRVSVPSRSRPPRTARGA